MGNEALVNAILAGAAGSVLLVSVVWYVLQAIANWKIFTKAGEAGWKSIIPFYSEFVTYRICWDTKWFWLALAAAIVSSVVSNMSEDSTSLAIALVGLVFALITLVMKIIERFKLSKAFGHGTGFAIGLIILDPIFLLILGFGSSEYVREKKNEYL